MKIYFLGLLVSIPFLGLTQKKQVCYTIDDLPAVSYGQTDQFYLWDMTLGLISPLDKYEIPALAFVNEAGIYSEEKVDSTQLDLLKLWFQNGYEVGNHTYSHMSYHGNAFEDFKEDVIKGERISRHLEQEYNKELRYFRHPYVNIGETKERYDSLNVLLDSLGYLTAPVTISNHDWVFANAYAAAERKNATDTMTLIGEAYIDFSREMIKYTDDKTLGIMGRDVPQVFLLHANKLNADYMDEVSELWSEADYEFVSLEEALRDKAYEIEITKFNPWGTNWIDAWAHTLGKTYQPTLKYPTIPGWIEDYK